MQIKDFKTSNFHLQEVNSVWRNVLHLGTQQKVPKHFAWYGQTDTFSFIDQGCVRLECISPSGRQRIAFFMNSGCLFRDIAMFSAEINFASTLITTEESLIYHFPRSLLFDNDFIRKYPELMSNLVFSLSKKGGAFFALLAEASEQVPDEILCRYIEALATAHDSNVFSPNISQVDLALNLGMHRSTVCRVIKSLRVAGILGTFSRHKLEILDRKKLQEYCGGHTNNKDFKVI